ncbi:MAG: 3-oxoacyl-ACP reductase FabG [Clostridia bacterium]|nr:3-oxoacyl-ACP reductase FabG [Clostridia bacterium]
MVKSKVVLITGASRGIGRNIASTLARKGYIIVANYNKSEKQAEDLKQELKEENINIDIYKADVQKRNEVREMVSYVLNKYGKIDVLINNAGISESKMFLDETDEDWNNIINTNLYSAFCTTQEVLPNMIHNKNGCIINISSIWGIVGASCETIYSISKAGIDAMTKSLAKELGPSNIRVNSIAPGIIDTEMNSNLGTEELNQIIEEIPLERIGKTLDVSKCVNWLIEDDYTTGQIISINGGWIIT